MLDIDELEELLDGIRIRVLEANRRGTLEELLTKMGMCDLIKPVSEFESYRDGKIVVIGASEAKEDVLTSIARKVGIDKAHFEFCLDYHEAQKYNYRKLQYASQYRVVLFGAVPHSAVGKRDGSSIITEMESCNGYPRIERLWSNGAMKITKSNFKAMLEKLLTEQYI